METMHEHSFIEEEHDRDEFRTTQESTNEVTVSLLAEMVHEQNLDDEFHDAFPEFEELMHNPCLELGPQENNQVGCQLFAHFLLSLSLYFKELILGQIYFMREML